MEVFNDEYCLHHSPRPADGPLMGSVCELCGKRPSFGNKVERLGKGAITRRVKSRTRRRFNPNIQRVRAVVDGSVKRIDVCTSCIKAGRVQKPPHRDQRA